MKNKKNSTEILIILVIILAVASAILPCQLSSLDELWNYNFAKNIAEGRLPYKDFNMLQMPLLPLICGFFLKCIANELIVMRALAIILCSAILYISYKIFRKIGINQCISILSIILLYFLLYSVFCIDYNFAILLITLLGIYLEIDKENMFKSEPKKDFSLRNFNRIVHFIKTNNRNFLKLNLYWL